MKASLSGTWHANAQCTKAVLTFPARRPSAPLRTFLSHSPLSPQAAPACSSSYRETHLRISTSWRDVRNSKQRS